MQQHRLASVLSACERAKDADVAKQASGFAAEQGLQLDVASTNALITALCRGGAFKDGDRHFSRHLRRHALPRILPGGTDVAEAFGWDAGDCCADEDYQVRFVGADGECDSVFNTERFGWDGGDCCANDECITFENIFD